MHIIAMNMFDIAAKLVVVVFVCAFLLLAFTLRCSLHSGPPD